MAEILKKKDNVQIMAPSFAYNLKSFFSFLFDFKPIFQSNLP